ncbi:CehA/McbA family metallohydrolase [Dyella mobilis]|uniref:CehA/McbA family metallohydrolase n=1 Tax=Dyella mobilis TaxID=1849582 RepID=A0ABS2KEW7_9GAMM|nr:CehA/McbA family metallohydrolase [Dyella mobilis]MBM7129590.1 CehA/McbA family metallohydrolase [Dyella mobilis]GLQ98146.1 hypothetical protein GCM10007863_25660 [Dyella mobilis]
MKIRSAIGSLVLMALLLCSACIVHADDTPPSLVLKGQVRPAENHTYQSVPFEVPANVNRITIQFDYTGRNQRTTIDLGLLGPDGFRGQDGFRGWSGGSKKIFTVSATDATPSFLPGAIRPGRWTLLLGIPNIRPNATADYTAKVWFGHPGDPAWLPEVLNPPLRQEAGWYRGDLHMHGAHSDGSCASQSGKQVPCPLFLTIDAALQRGLDFIALSDHNSVSQANDIRELQPYYDRLLLIPARELTTFTGHANLFGSDQPIDFRVGSTSVPDWNTLLRAAATLHGLVSINHPIRPDDETCMGCGWAPAKPVDMHLVQAIEAVNGIDAMLPDSGIPFWQHLLDQGYRLTGVGGSDNHDAKQSIGTLIGTPTTVVHASELSMPAILAGIRAGHVFIDVQGTRDRFLDLSASVGTQTADMGDAITLAAGQRARITVKASAPQGSRAEIIVDGKVWQPPNADLLVRGTLDQSFDWQSDGKRHWIRANVRGAAGELLLVGNPVYVN